MNEIQQANNYSVQKPDIAITDNAFMHCTSVTKAVVDRIRAATWDEISTVDDMGFQVIARAIKDRQARNEGVLMEELCDLMCGEPEEEPDEEQEDAEDDENGRTTCSADA